MQTKALRCDAHPARRAVRPQRSASVRINTRPSSSLGSHSYPHTCATIQTHADHQPRHAHSRSGRRHERSRVLCCRCCRWRIERRQQHLTGQSRCSTTTTHIHIPLAAKLGKKHGARGFERGAGRVSPQSTSAANTAAIRMRALRCVTDSLICAVMVGAVAFLPE